MSVLGDKIKAANANRDRASCTFELGGESVTIYAKPITGMDIEALQRKHKDFVNNPTLGAAVDMIVRKAETEEGEPAFDVEDKPILLNQTIDFISKIRSELFPDEGVPEDVEDDIKN